MNYKLIHCLIYELFESLNFYVYTTVINKISAYEKRIKAYYKSLYDNFYAIC